MSNFPIVIFQSSLSVGGLLFGVFGFMYTAYVAHYSRGNPTTPRITNTVRIVCQFISILICLDALVAICSLFNVGILSVGSWSTLFLSDFSGNTILGSLLVIITLSLAIFSLMWAWRFMEKPPTKKFLTDGQQQEVAPFMAPKSKS